MEAVDSKRRSFIWTGEASCTGGQCKVAWELVCLDKEKGGLGVKNLALQNRALICKFWSKLHQPPRTSWQHWFLRTYGAAAGRDLGDAHWLDTLTWSMLLSVLPEFRISTRVHLGDGSSTSFWYDHWIGHLLLAEAFPALLSHCLRPNVTVAAAWNGLAWDLFLCTRLSANATQEYTILTEALALVQPSTEADRRGIGPAMAPLLLQAGLLLEHGQAPRRPVRRIHLEQCRDATMQALPLAWTQGEDSLGGSPTPTTYHRQ